MEIIFDKTQRGFRTGTFVDRYGEKCSIQKSSLAGEEAIWLGIDDANPQIMNSRAHEVGLKPEADNGWMKFPVPHQVLMSTRMHLTQEQVKSLLPILQKFVETGEI